MAEKSVDHGIYMDRTMLEAAKSDRRLGVLLGAGLFALLIACALLCIIYAGSVGGGSLFLCAATMGGVGLFARTEKARKG